MITHDPLSSSDLTTVEELLALLLELVHVLAQMLMMSVGGGEPVE